MVSSLYLPLTLLAAVLGSGLALFAWRHRETPGSGPLALLLLAASLWALTDALSLVSLQTVFWARLKVCVSAVVPLAWLLVVFEYTGRERWLAGPRLLALLIEPIVFSALVWTNDSHDLVWTTVGTTQLSSSHLAFDAVEGLAFWGHLTYSYLLIVAGAALLVVVLFRTDDVFRTQSTALLAAVVIPMVVNALYVYDVISIGIDPTGMAFVLMGSVLVGAILRENLLDVSPATRELGREEAIDQLEDRVLIVDSTGSIVDLNPAAESLFDVEAESTIGEDLSALAPTLADSIEGTDPPGEVTLEQGGIRRHYDVRVSELDRGYGVITGRIVSLRDVTERTQREQRLDVMNRLFRHNLRNEMNVVRGNAELLRDDVQTGERRERTDRIIDTVDEVIDRSDKIGTLAGSLEDEPTTRMDLVRIVERVVSSLRSETAEATLSMESADECPIVADPSIEIAARELLENAIEHADGPTVSVSLSRTDDGAHVELVVADDGPGIPGQELAALSAGTETPLQHGSGIGLWMVTWVVERFGGTTDFEVTDDGTTVTVRLPCAEDGDSSAGRHETGDRA